MNQTCAKICPPPASTSLYELDNYIAKFSHETARNLWESCPNKKRHQGFPGVSANLLQKIKIKHNLQRQVRDHPNIPHLKTQLNTIRKEITQELAQEKDNRLQREIAGMDPKHSKNFGKTFNKAARTEQKDKKQVYLTDPATGNTTSRSHHLTSHLPTLTTLVKTIP